MYSAIAKTKLRLGDWLVLPGAGGGLGHMLAFRLSTYLPLSLSLTIHSGLQIAVKRGFKVIAVDRYLNLYIRDSSVRLNL